MTCFRAMRDRLLTTKEVAELVGVSLATFYAWRSQGKGPVGVSMGRYVRFRAEDVEAWIDSRREEDR